jgi:hypothetical protein
VKVANFDKVYRSKGPATEIDALQWILI